MKFEYKKASSIPKWVKSGTYISYLDHFGKAHIIPRRKGDGDKWDCVSNPYFIKYEELEGMIEEMKKQDHNIKAFVYHYLKPKYKPHLVDNGENEAWSSDGHIYIYIVPCMQIHLNQLTLSTSLVVVVMKIRDR